ncbi:MAG: hypothetical protein R3E10_03805 [Gemmatimonadota bacterium]
MALPALRTAAVLWLALLSPYVLGAQTVADSVSVLVAAATGFDSVNGPATEVTNWFVCITPRPDGCNGLGLRGVRATGALSAVAERLGLAPDPDGIDDVPNCPWNRGAPDGRRGVTLDFGLPAIDGTRARVHVGLRCSGSHGAFVEGGVVELEESAGAWKVVEIWDRFIT